MRKAIFFFVAISIAAISCNTETEPDKSEPANKVSTDHLIVADNIIYDVVVQSDNNDPWEQEKVKGYSGEEMINNLFEGIYAGSLKVFDYHSGEKLSAKDIRKIESQEGFNRSNIGKIQFTENWYYNPDKQIIEKIVTRLVFGYKTLGEDQAGAGYMASFEIAFE